MEQIKIKLDGGIMPHKAHPTDAAYDLYVPEDVVLRQGRQVVDMKFSMELPRGYAATIQPRSGFSVKGIEVDYVLDDKEQHCYVRDEHRRIDADVIRGLIDEKYRNNIGVIIRVADWITEKETVTLKRGTRIAQMQIIEIPQTELIETDELDMSEDRGGGFGHTGAK
jgi:dUTPase